MLICTNCDSAIDDDAHICPFCGTKIEHKEKQDNSMEQFSDYKIKLDDSDAPNLVIEKQVALPQPAIDSSSEVLIVHSPDIEDVEMSEIQNQNIPISLSQVPERNYLIWFILGVVTVGICFLIYLYLNIEDLEKHSHYPLELKAKPIKANASSLLLLFFISICFLFIPILWYIYYLKYASLYNHIREQKKDTAPIKLLHPVFYMIPLVLSHTFALVPSIIQWVFKIDIKAANPGLFWSIFAIIIVLTLLTSIMDYYWQKAFNKHNQIAMVNMNGIKFSEGY